QTTKSGSNPHTNWRPAIRRWSPAWCGIGWNRMTEDGLNRAAILLLSLGEQEAAEVFKFLGPKEVQKLGAAMTKLKNVKREKIEEVLEAFHADTNVQTSLGMDSNEYIRSVLTRALGEERATHLIDRILQGGDTSGIEGLKWME